MIAWYELLTIFAVAYVLIRLSMKLAPVFGLVDIPNERSFHRQKMPRSGGIGIFSAFFLTMALFHGEFIIQKWYIFAAVALIFLTGVTDDRTGLSPKVKFLMIFAATLLLWYNGIAIFSVGNWFGLEGDLPEVVAILFSLFALSGFTNAINLIDGLDGLAATLGSIIIAAFLAIGLINHDNGMFLLSVYMLAVLGAFLLLNLYPAKVFMGDSGSLTLGFFISVLAVMSIEYIHPIIVLYLGAVPVLDTIIVMIRRHQERRSPFDPDKTHVHHLLYEKYRSVPKVVMLLAAAQAGFILLGWGWEKLIEYDPYGIAPMGALLVFILFYKLAFRRLTQMLHS